MVRRISSSASAAENRAQGFVHDFVHCRREDPDSPADAGREHPGTSVDAGRDAGGDGDAMTMAVSGSGDVGDDGAERGDSAS